MFHTLTATGAGKGGNCGTSGIGGICGDLFSFK